jgi:NAD-dependent dihydropyrimidine dehydrogenase PreA subunit
MAAKIDIEKCNGCGRCKDICPVGVVTIENNKAIISDGCIECGICVNQCPTGAIQL